jgi:Flp pilus assembly protein TadD
MEGIVDGARAGVAPARRRTEAAKRDMATIYSHDADLLMKQRRYAEAETLLRPALRLRPDDADILNMLGAAIWEQGRPSEAEHFFSRAHEIRPNDAAILNHLGLARWDQGRSADAADCYRRALKLNPHLVDAQMNLGVVLSDLGEFDEALDWLHGVVRERPNMADGLQNMGMTLARLGRWNEALKYYDRALSVNPDYAEVHRNRAYARLFLGDFERGWPEHEWRLKCRRHLGCKVERPYWRGERLDDKIIVLHFEQGYGDTLQFIRYAPLVKQRVGTVLVLCQPRLLRIVARCPGVDLAFDGSSFAPHCDVHASLMSLPALLGTTQATVPARVPYLFNDPVVLDRWRSVLAGALGADYGVGRESSHQTAGTRPGRPFLVGVAWQGSPTHLNDHWRSFPLAQLLPLAKLPGVRLINLQVDHGLDQLRAMAGQLPIIELNSSPRDFSDTAAIVSQLDLVITPDTAMAHLSGGLGVPVWGALSTVAEWRWMIEREDSPWYPTMRLFRQTKLGDWEGVFNRMADALRPILERRTASMT